MDRPKNQNLNRISNGGRPKIGLIEVNGDKNTLKQWSKVTGICYSTLLQRYQKGRRDIDLISPLYK